MRSVTLLFLLLLSWLLTQLSRSDHRFFYVQQCVLVLGFLFDAVWILKKTIAFSSLHPSLRDLCWLPVTIISFKRKKYKEWARIGVNGYYGLSFSLSMWDLSIFSPLQMTLTVLTCADRYAGSLFVQTVCNYTEGHLRDWREQGEKIYIKGR